MTIQGGFGERPLTAENMLEQLNRIWLPLLKKMLAGQNALVTVSDTAPSTPTTGDFWYDTGGPTLNIWDGSAWAAI